MESSEQAARAAVLEAARQWLGTPYHHAARIQGAGVDCAQLLIAVYHAGGLIPDLDPRPYPPDWHLHRSDERYLGWVLRHSRPVEVPRVGDLALFRFGRCYSHGAIIEHWSDMCQPGRPAAVIHAYLGEGCVRADLDKHPLAGRPVKFFSPWSAA